MKKLTQDRESIFSYYEHYSEDTKYQIDNYKTKNTLLKSYIFETFNLDLPISNSSALEIPNLYNNNKIQIKQVDDTLFCLFRESEFIGSIEKINDRFNFFHTPLTANVADQLVKSFLKNSKILDCLWLSGKLFDQLLNNIISYHSGHRYTKLKFESNLLFEEKKVPEELFTENKGSSMSFTEDLENLIYKINGVRDYLPLFHSITSLRLPSKTGAGGHDFYSNGKVTNRSTSFYDHRSQIINVVKSYQTLTETIENRAWIELEKVPDSPDKNTTSFKACPVYIGFNSEIPTNVLERFVYTAFKKGTEPFKIIGDVYKVSTNRYHIYGTDLHLWQSIFIDISTSNIIVYLPYGTCGNTVHRLVTNIQKYLCPNLDIYVGEDSFEDIIKTTFMEI